MNKKYIMDNNSNIDDKCSLKSNSKLFYRTQSYSSNIYNKSNKFQNDNDKINNNLRRYWNESLKKLYRKKNVNKFNNSNIYDFLNTKFKKFEKILNKLSKKFNNICNNIHEKKDDLNKLKECVEKNLNIGSFINIERAIEVINSNYDEIIENYKTLKNLFIIVKNLLVNKPQQNDYTSNVNVSNSIYEGSNKHKIKNINFKKSYSNPNEKMFFKDNNKLKFFVNRNNNNSLLDKNYISPTVKKCLSEQNTKILLNKKRKRESSNLFFIKK